MPVRTCPQCGADYALNQKFCALDGAVLTTEGDDDSLIGKIIAGGRYHVLKQLGEGGMGQVFLAEQVRMDRKCALKVLRPQFASEPGAISRFNREAKNASRIDHPNVARVYEFGDAEHGVIYLAMEFIDGRALSAELGKSTSIEPIRAGEIVRQVADALLAAHELDITHRDLKPDNIMLRRNRNGTETVKVVDFGISKVAGELAQQVTMSGGVVGTPAYMSPEQVRGAAVDARSDIFSLGLVAFKMLTGGLPYTGDTGMDSMVSRLSERPLRLSEVRRDFDWGPSLEAVMDRVLAADPKDRYPTAPEFAQAFQDAIRSLPAVLNADETTLLFPPGPAPRRRATPMLVGAVLLIGAAISVGALWNRDTPPPAGTTPPVESPPIALRASGGPVAPAPGAPRIDSLAARRESSPISPLPRPQFRVRVAGLPSALRAQIAELSRTIPGVLVLTDTAGSADLTLVTAANGTTYATGPGGEARASNITPAAFRQTFSQLIRQEAARNGLEALETPSSRDGLALAFADGRGSYAIGDEIRFRLQSERGGFLTLLDLSPDGTITVLHPSAMIDVGRLAAKTPMTLPGPSDAVFRASLPAGTGLVRAIVTASPLLRRRDGDLLTSKDDPMLIEKLRRSLERMGTGATWSTRAIPYTVRP